MFGQCFPLYFPPEKRRRIRILSSISSADTGIVPCVRRSVVKGAHMMGVREILKHKREPELEPEPHTGHQSQSVEAFWAT